MKRHQTICLLAAGAALLSISGHAQQSQEKLNLQQRVQVLEKQLAETTGILAGLAEASRAEAAQLDAINRYLQKQAAAASGMVKTIASSESQGFVAGINFPSRETLLAGWRQQLAVTLQGVPGNSGSQPEGEGSTVGRSGR